MGRSYSEYPFHQQQPMLGVQGSGPRLGNDEDKQKLGQQKSAPPDAPSGFRQPHAETIQRYQKKKTARRAAAKEGAGTGRRAAAKKTPAARKASAAKKAPAAKKAVTGRKSPRQAPAAAPKSASGSKIVSRVAAAAKKSVKRVARKIGVGKSPKKR
ncbi:hypothetical protein [Hyalangium gracile]|uniref:hypothetical protein n=1 Tax=Hyalangium gracile TaxID=394092 RepID=UPI001CCC061F|nr:hypothetical protein [Hyalangium gracile]